MRGSSRQFGVLLTVLYCLCIDIVSAAPTVAVHATSGSQRPRSDTIDHVPAPMALLISRKLLQTAPTPQPTQAPQAFSGGAVANQRNAAKSEGMDPSLVIGILLAVISVLACVAGGVYVYKFRHVGKVHQAGTTTTTADGRVVAITGGGKAMKRTDFEAKVGKYGFDNADKDNSNAISKDEWMELFNEVDINGDGEISKQEWESAFGKGTFDAWDKDGNGVIDLREWKKIFMSRKTAAASETKDMGGPGGSKLSKADQAKADRKAKAKHAHLDNQFFKNRDQKANSGKDGSKMPRSKANKLKDVTVTDL